MPEASHEVVEDGACDEVPDVGDAVVSTLLSQLVVCILHHAGREEKLVDPVIESIEGIVQLRRFRVHRGKKHLR